MRYLFLFCFWLATVAGMAQSVQIEGTEFVLWENFQGGPLYVLRLPQKNASPTGRAVFTPGGDGWGFGWSYEGESKIVEPYEDSTRLEVNLQASGLYKMWATKEGHEPVETVFNVFYDFMDFKIKLDDEFNCEEIKIQIEYLDLPKFKDCLGMEEVEVDCWVIWNGQVRQLVSLKDYVYRELSQSVTGCSQNVFCSVRIKDRFGLTWESEAVEYHSVIPKAEAELEFDNEVVVVGEVNDKMGQAPLEVYFHNHSVNASSYEWLLFKDTADLNVFMPDLRDSLLETSTQKEFPYVYEHTGRYKVQLIAENIERNHCRDTSQAYYVNVVESKVDVPNVFTPNGDGKNDVFMAMALSVEHFHGVILNRLGRKVYEWSDPNGGWDGRINGKYATPGTYFYIITARGLEKNNPPRYVKKGALMLIR